MTDEPIKLDGCPACGYDMTGAPSSICPECGADLGHGAEIIRQNVARRSIWWIIAGGLLIAATVLYRLIYLSNRGFSTLSVAIGAVAVVAVVSAAGIDFVVRRPEAVRRVVFIIWLRSSFWLYLPWIVVPALVLIAQMWQRLATRGMTPGQPAIAEHWHAVSMLPCAGFAIVPIIAVVIWSWRWRSLHRKAMVPEPGLLGPVATAIFCEAIVMGCISFDLMALFNDV